MFLFLLGLSLLGVATALVVRAVTRPDLKAAESLAQIAAYGFKAEDAPGEAPRFGARGAVDSLAGRIGTGLAARFPAAEEGIRAQLLGAGLYTTQPATFLGYRALASACGGLALLWLAGAGEHSGGMVLLATIFGAFAGWVLPQSVLRRKAQHRLGQVDIALPELIDLLVVTVEAGLGFSRSMQVAASNLHGPLGDELRLAVQEQRMGLASTEALSSILRRCDTPSMRSFVRSVIQGETLGVSMGTIMRNLATEMRKRRRASAEERAQKAPVKMLFPLVFLIFPPIFIILLYPAIYNFGQSFGA
jgi:tight adherence protein C